MLSDLSTGLQPITGASLVVSMSLVMRGENYGNHLTINHHIWHRIVSDDEVTDEDDRDLDEFFF